MNENLSLDADFTAEQYRQQEFPIQQFANPDATAVSSINGLSGPSVVLDGGTSGFSYSTAAPNVTLNSPLTTKGDLYVRNATVGTRLAVGANDSYLAADSTQATGLVWIAASTGWAAWTGSATRTSKATYPSTTASVGYTASELQGVMHKLKEVSEALKAIIDDQITQKRFKA